MSRTECIAWCRVAHLHAEALWTILMPLDMGLDYAVLIYAPVSAAVQLVPGVGEVSLSCT